MDEKRAVSLEKSIPRVIHQTWKNHEVPSQFLRFQRSWPAYNPQWEYRFWTDATARQFVADHVPWFLARYDAYPFPIQRVDAVRYIWMYVTGGVYADLDCECLRPIDPLLEGRELVFGLEHPEHVTEWVAQHGLDRIVGNAFIASRPGHPFWEHLLRMMAEVNDFRETMTCTGPFILTRAIQSYAQPEEIAVMPASALYPATKPEVWRAEEEGARLTFPPDAFAVHHYVGTWWRKPSTPAPPPVTDTRVRSPRRPVDAFMAEPPPAPADLSAPKILIATPVKDARAYLPAYFENLRKLTYPHHRLSVAFLESDSVDGTYEWLNRNAAGALPGFARVEAHKVDFGYRPSGPRWALEIQRRRRGILAKSRNRLLQRSLTDETWVLWIDSDVVRYPHDVIERLLETGRDIVVPHCLGPDGRTFDLNTFRLTGGDLDLSPYVTDGIVQPPRGYGRTYLDELSHEELARVDAVGGTMLLVRADHHRDGLIFPPYSHRLYIETEGLAMMAADMGIGSWALPRLLIHHV